MVYSAKKRFLAGATCPECKVTDRIVVFNEDGVDFRECVSCGFKDAMRIQSAPIELNTRVSPEKVVDEPVKIMMPPKTSD